MLTTNTILLFFVKNFFDYIICCKLCCAFRLIVTLYCEQERVEYGSNVLVPHLLQIRVRLKVMNATTQKGNAKFRSS